MTRFVSASILGAFLAAGLTAGGAQAEERDRDRGRVREVCTWVTKCHREDGRRQCHREKECKMVRVDRR